MLTHFFISNGRVFNKYHYTQCKRETKV